MTGTKEKQIVEIVSMIDQFMAGNGGHMNIRVFEDRIINGGDTLEKSVTTINSADCAGGNSACRVPTLFEGMDIDDEDPENIY